VSGERWLVVGEKLTVKSRQKIVMSEQTSRDLVCRRKVRDHGVEGFVLSPLGFDPNIKIDNIIPDPTHPQPLRGRRVHCDYLTTILQPLRGKILHTFTFLQKIDFKLSDIHTFTICYIVGE
jgi:hypothetical protein